MRLNYVMKNEQEQQLIAVGDGNATEGIRALVAAWDAAGRPALTGGEVARPGRAGHTGASPMVRRNFRIEDTLAGAVKQAGGGKNSIGLRRLLAWYEARREADDGLYIL